MTKKSKATVTSTLSTEQLRNVVGGFGLVFFSAKKKTSDAGDNGGGSSDIKTITIS